MIINVIELFKNVYFWSLICWGFSIEIGSGIIDMVIVYSFLNDLFWFFYIRNNVLGKDDLRYWLMKLV